MRNRVGLWIVVGLLLAAAGGCAFLRKPKVAPIPPPTDEQLAFWEANNEHAHYVPGKGYAIDGQPGFYDDQGRPIPGGSVGRSGPPGSEFRRRGGVVQRAVETDHQQFEEARGPGPQRKDRQRRPLPRAIRCSARPNMPKRPSSSRSPTTAAPTCRRKKTRCSSAAESYFFSDQYSKANDYYGLLVKKYTNTGYLDQIVARRFAIARYWEECDHKHHHYALTPNLRDKTRPHFDTRGHCLKCYDRVRLDDPTGPLADDSIMASANAYFSWGMYEDADYFYTLLQKEYPRSEHQFNAHLLGFKIKLLRYQGPDYGNKPLDEADELAKQLLTQFPSELGEERQRIVDAQSQIAAHRAQREFQVAEYYAKNKYYGASRIYYQNVINNWPDTQLAQKSKARIDEYKDKPAVSQADIRLAGETAAGREKTGNLGYGVATSGIPSRHGTGVARHGNDGWHGVRQHAGRAERNHDSLIIRREKKDLPWNFASRRSVARRPPAGQCQPRMPLWCAARCVG